jgi:hypothetical protein
MNKKNILDVVCLLKLLLNLKLSTSLEDAILDVERFFDLILIFKKRKKRRNLRCLKKEKFY